MTGIMKDAIIRMYFSDKSKKKAPRRKIFTQRKRIVKILIVSAITAGVIYWWLICVHYFNTFSTMQQHIYAQASRIEIEYQRRAELIPMLVNISKKYAAYERDLIQYIADARLLKAAAADLEKNGTTQNAEIEQKMSRLVALAEQHPDLKATQNFQKLMKQWVTTENRIAFARERYNEYITNYNNTLQLFPERLFAGRLGFSTLERYQPKKNPMPIRVTNIFFQ